MCVPVPTLSLSPHLKTQQRPLSPILSHTPLSPWPIQCLSSASHTDNTAFPFLMQSMEKQFPPFPFLSCSLRSELCWGEALQRGERLKSPPSIIFPSPKRTLLTSPNNRKSRGRVDKDHGPNRRTLWADSSLQPTSYILLK